MCLLMVSKSNSNTASIVLIINSCKNTHESLAQQSTNTHTNTPLNISFCNVHSQNNGYDKLKHTQITFKMKKVAPIAFTD